LSAAVRLRVLGGQAAGQQLAALVELYAEVYGEPPYNWGHEHVALFAERFAGQRQQDGFRLVEAREGDQLIGVGFGVTLRPNTPWWQNLLTTLPTTMTTEYPNRTFALVELLVGEPWRRQHIAEHLHDRLLADRPEERATLTVLPAATAAQVAYHKWGWQKVAQKRNPLPGSPVFDVMVKALRDKPRLDLSGRCDDNNP
jgi:hypothetical protein